MAEVAVSVARKGAGSFECVVTEELEEGTTLYWYLDGQLVEAGPGRFRVIDVGPGDESLLEVFDDSGDVPTPGYPGRLRLQWDRVDGAVMYRVYQWDFAADPEAWKLVRSYPATQFDTGVYTHETEALADGTEYRYRVVAEGPVLVGAAGGGAGNAGPAREWAGVIVRRPQAVKFAVALVDGALTVSAA